MTPVRVGQVVEFDPFHGLKYYGADVERKIARGVVVAVYPEHRWFSVKYDGLRTSFNFCDVGVTVNICG